MTMMRTSLFAAAVIGFAGSAFAQGTKPITFECAYNSSRKEVEILGNNPNPVRRICKASCTYTNKEKQSAYDKCEGISLSTGTKRPMCGDKPQGTAPYSNFKVTGSC